MFSRIQTLFLLLAIVFTALTFAFPLISGNIGLTHFDFYTYGIYADKHKPEPSWLYIPAVVILFCLLFALAQFKNRKRQMLVCRITYLLIIVQLGLHFFIPENTLSEARKEIAVNTHYGISLFLPLLTLIFTFLAEKFISKDEKLVRSADRLR